MALTITSATPNIGLTGGREFVLIQGTDFNISVNTDGSSKMEVFFGLEQATRVRVRSTTTMDCLSPIHDLGQVDVKVVDTVSTDEDTLSNGFTYKRPVIGGDTYQSDLWRAVASLVEELRRQIIANVVTGGEVDYDGSPNDLLNIIEIAKVPAIVLEGPKIIGSIGSLRRVGEPWEEVATDHFKRLRTQEYLNLEFSLTGVDDHKIRLTNLLREVVSFFTRNPVLRLLLDPANPSLGYTEIDMRPPNPQEWRTISAGNKSSLKFFTGPFTLWGVPIGHDDYIEETRGITEFNIQSSQL